MTATAPLPPLSLMDPDRPVTPRDLERLRQRLGLNIRDFQWVFGIRMDKWSQMLKKMDEPVSDPSIAIWARMLSTYPELCPTPPEPTPDEMYETITALPQYKDLPHRVFAAMFGRDATSAHRWLQQGQQAGPVARRLFVGLQTLIRMKKGEAVEAWQEQVSIEARARNLPNVWQEGLWGQRGSKEED